MTQNTSKGMQQLSQLVQEIEIVTAHLSSLKNKIDFILTSRTEDGKSEREDAYLFTTPLTPVLSSEEYSHENIPQTIFSEPLNIEPPTRRERFRCRSPVTTISYTPTSSE